MVNLYLIPKKKEYIVYAIRSHKEYNNWLYQLDYEVMVIEKLPKTNRHILKLLRNDGYLTDKSKGKVSLTTKEDNLILSNRKTGKPLFIIQRSR